MDLPEDLFHGPLETLYRKLSARAPDAPVTAKELAEVVATNVAITHSQMQLILRLAESIETQGRLLSALDTIHRGCTEKVVSTIGSFGTALATVQQAVGLVSRPCYSRPRLFTIEEATAPGTEVAPDPEVEPVLLRFDSD